MIRCPAVLLHHRKAPAQRLGLYLFLSTAHHGKEVRKWLVHHLCFVVHFTPVHGSWMNQVEQWFSILQRKRLRIVDFDSKDHLRQKLEQFIREWNVHAHPFNWSSKSVAKVMVAAPAMAA